MPQTNDVLARVRDGLQTLCDWAQADAEHSDEMDAPEQAQDDRMRLLHYRSALSLLDEQDKKV